MDKEVPLRPTVAEIDLDAIASNVRALGAAASADVIAVVKADAYGHGAEAVGATALEAGATMLAVATIEEAVVLRRAGIAAPILVLLGVTSREEADTAIAQRLVVAVWQLDHASLLSDAARALNSDAVVHFKVDTGLTRLGAPLDEAAERYEAVRALPRIAIEGAYTHLASADDPDTTEADKQVARFLAFVDRLSERPRWLHAAASAGTAAFGTRPPLNAIRPGLAVYGLSPAPHLLPRVAIRPALSWRSQVRRVAAAKRGTGVSYGLDYRLPRDGRIATIPVGYGDGLPRVGGGGHVGVLIRGRRIPIAGRIAMDLVMVDVTAAPDVAEGDEVVIIGAQSGARQTVEDLAAACDTISWEIVTGITPRVPRRYLRGGRLVGLKTMADGFRWC